MQRDSTDNHVIRKQTQPFNQTDDEIFNLLSDLYIYAFILCGS